MMKKSRNIVLLLSALFALSACQHKETEQMNLLWIITDEHNFRTLGCYRDQLSPEQAFIWGPQAFVETPNIDALAKESTRLTSFYTGPTCSPTRGMLLTGTDAHVNGFGTMIDDWADNQLGLRGYEGYLNFDLSWSFICSI